MPGYMKVLAFRLCPPVIGVIGEIGDGVRGEQSEINLGTQCGDCGTSRRGSCDKLATEMGAALRRVAF
jgi:hypothetical protein